MKRLLTISSLFILLLSTIFPTSVLAQIAEDQQELETEKETHLASDSNTNEAVIEESKEVDPATEVEDESEDIANLETEEVSFLGKVTNKEAVIFEDSFDEAIAEKIDEDDFGKTYFIIKQLELNNSTYYLIARNLTDENQVIGWIQDSDIESSEYLERAESKTVYLTGEGLAYKDYVRGNKLFSDDLGEFTDQEFAVEAIVEVEDETWYSGQLEDQEQNIWIESDYTTEEAPLEETETKVSETTDESEEVDKEVTETDEKTAETSEEAVENFEIQTFSKQEKSVPTVSSSNDVTLPKNANNTSRLGHLKGTSRYFYGTPGDEATRFSSSGYTNAVYYIKSEITIGGQKYYLLSREPSRVSGLVGWMKANDLSTHSHIGVDRKSKDLYIKGTGKAYTKAWGGNKDLVYNLADYKDQLFRVHLTERVGNNIWYRGTLDGKTVWIHNSYVESRTIKTSKTSKLGHIRSGKNKIYKTIADEGSSFTAGSTYTNAVYYIKEEAVYNKETYYKISTSPSATQGVIGWMKANDLSTHSHVGVDKHKKSATIKGQNNAYAKAWGGSKDLVYNLSAYKDKEFSIHLTEKVGKNTWYRGTLDGKTVWIHESHLNTVKQVGNKREIVRVTQNIGITLSEMVNRQMKVNPQTDRNLLWIREDGLNIKSGSNRATVKGSGWRLRDGPGTSYAHKATLNNGDDFVIEGSKRNSIGETWYFTYKSTGKGWTTAFKGNVEYYLDPSNFMGSLAHQLQFLDLASTTGLTASQINNEVLKGKGILEGQAAAFIKAGKEHGLNEVYLISHSLLETGNGKSTLAKGVKYKGKTVYNMYGIGAYDSCPIDCGAEHAYEQKWFTPEAAIIGGAAFIGNDYVKKGQNTIYSMRWQPTASHQYATDIGWAVKQTSQMASIYSTLSSYSLRLIIPKYR